MILFICLFFPALCSLYIYGKLSKTEYRWPQFIMQYAVFNLLINIIVWLALAFLFGNAHTIYSGSLFAVITAVKYLCLAVPAALVLPCILYYKQFYHVHLGAPKAFQIAPAGAGPLFRHLAKKTLCILFLYLTALIMLTCVWAVDSFGTLNVSSIIFQLKVPMTGMSHDFMSEYLIECVLKAAVLPLAFFFLTELPIEKALLIDITLPRKNRRIYLLPVQPLAKNRVLISCIALIMAIIYGMLTLDVLGWLLVNVKSSNFIETHYVDPREVTITFPEEKRNLIYIFMESMETTMLSEELGGAHETNIIPELAELAQTHINFSNTQKLGGAFQFSTTNWTMAGMVAQHGGMNLALPVVASTYGEFSTFLPGLYSLGDIFQKEGYNQALMVGSDAVFGGRKNFYEHHGNARIYDYNTAIEDGLIHDDYYVWWGIEDEKLYQYARQELTQIAQEEEPFVFTMLTVDTHHIDGYVCRLCGNEHEKQYANVYACASRQAAEFVEWIMQQDFYENTTIVIAGDHLSMDPDYFEDIRPSYERTTLNIYINSALDTDFDKNRQFGTFDLFPTTLASLGITIEGDRLGIGTNLFSGKPTLAEEYGADTVEEHLVRRSKFYNRKILEV